MIKADVEAVDKERNVALVFVVTLWKCGEGIGGSCEEGSELFGRYLLPVGNVIQWGIVADKVIQPARVSSRASAALITVADQPVFWHTCPF